MRRVTTVLLTLVGILLAGSHHVRASQQEQSKHTIVPGLGVGDYKLGMSKDEVEALSKSGKPERMYFVMGDGVVKEISVYSPLYKFTNGLGVGDSEEKIKPAFGHDFELREFETKDLLTYKNKGLQFKIHKESGTIEEITVFYQAKRSRGDSDAPGSVKVIMLSEQPVGPITFPKIDRRPKRRAGSDKMKYGPEELEILKLGKNPGLGVRTLHKRGITGKGVGVAIIDQTLLTEHQEYADRLRLYEENNIKDGARTRMHGSAVASIAVGKTLGVAPDADLYYIATMNWDVSKGDDPPINFRFKAQSIRRLLEINRQLPADRKIRVISMSRGWSPSEDGYDEIMAACEEAKADGIFLISCSIERIYGFKFHGLGRHPSADPDLFESYEPGLWWAKGFYEDAQLRGSDRLLVPMDSRTIADFRRSDEYLFCREGGWSWSVPYIAGVYALAAQVEPDITPERFWSLAMQTGRSIELDYNGKKIPFGPIIDPVRLIRSISDEVGTSQQAPSKNTIVPGIGIGDYTFGMSKDEVLKKLGEPEAIQLGGEDVNVVRRGEEKYSLDNLPNECVLSFGDISFWIDDDSIGVISVRSPLYKLSNGLGVGDLEQKIKQAFGEDFQLEEALGKHFRCYHAKGLGFEIDKKSQTVVEIIVYWPQGHPRVLRTLPKYDPASLRIPDLRSCDLTRLDLRKSIEDLMYADFDDRTVWPAPNRMPSEFDWKKVMELGKNPGLGVRSLHKKGITGRGVRVAILDQPLLVDHQEYAERLRLYEEIDLQGRTNPSFHGAAVASIALGKTVGVAPEAELYYIAQWNVDWDNKRTDSLRTLARGIHRMLEINERLPKDNKIRVISISKGWMRSHKDYKEITEAVQKAQAAGMLVVCSGLEHVHEGLDFSVLGRSPLADPEVFESYEPGLSWAKRFWARRSPPSDRSSPSGVSFSVPMDSRTTASETGSNEYVFHRKGGYSWAIPYIAGVYALAIQVDTAITPERFWALAVQTGRTIELNYNGKTRALGPIIDPVRLIRAIQAGEPATLNRKQSDNQQPDRGSSKDVLVLVRQAAAQGCIAFRRTTPKEFKEIAGQPTKEWTGGDYATYMEYPGIEVKFVGNGNSPHPVQHVLCERMGIDIGQDRPTDERDLHQQSDRRSGKDASTLVRQAAAQGRILFKLTMPEEFKEIVGQPTREEVGNRPGTRLNLFYPGVTVSFFGWPDEPRTLGGVWCESRQIDIGQNRPVVLRDEGDLSKFGKYNDICGADLSRLDLSQKGDLVERMTFDNLTVWPEPGRLPRGFEPSRRLEEGKTPGLGVRSLHQEGINGSGVGIAIVDGILRRDHIEYADRIKSYRDREIEIEKDKDFSSHAPPVCSIAVGKTCGVAPGASLHYYAAPLEKWGWSNRGFARTVEQIVERNRNLPPSEKVRVISISIGVTLRDHYDQWQAAADKAKKNGILVVTCDKQDFMPYGTLKRIVGKDPDDPNNYGPSYLSGDGNAPVWVPIENRSRASHRGKDVYTFDTYAGSSWAAPYLAGLAALAFQVHPGISPDEIVKLWQETATRTQVGPVVNPRGFIEAVKRLKRGIPR